MIATVTLQGRELVANGTMMFHFDKPDGFEYRAGQFGELTLLDPPETDAEGDSRAFSLASAPFEPGLAMATRLRDTAFKRVLRELPVGRQVRLGAPYGSFTLHRSVTTPAVFLIGGIGVTPVRSMVLQATHDRSDQSLLLVHAGTSPDDAPFLADFRAAEASNLHFRYVPTVERPSPGWTGETGRIDEAMLRRHVPDLDAPLYYLSGPAGMVTAMRSLLAGAGVDEERIRTEEFVGY